MFPSRYKKNGLPLGLIRIHQVIIKDTVDHFEKGKYIRARIKQARKAVKKALRVAKKQNINPGLKIGVALEAFEQIREELEYTRKSLLATSSQIYDALERIQQERIEEPLSLIENARELFREKQIERGIETLKKSQGVMEKKVLIKTRTAIFGGISNEVIDLKEEIEELRKGRRQRKKKKDR